MSFIAPVTVLPLQSTAVSETATSLPLVEPQFSSVVSSPFVVPTAPSPGGGGGGSEDGEESFGNTNAGDNASLYRMFHQVLSSMTYLTPWPVYAFLSSIILLLSVAGFITLRSAIFRRRYRRMVEEAIRNGTYIPPAHVDLSKKPQLWEAYLGGGGWQLGSIGSGSDNKKELGIGTDWKSEYSRHWESIKPICASYTEPLTSVTYSDPTPNLTSLSPLFSIPAPTSAPRGDDEENLRRTAEVSTTTPSSLTRRSRIFLNPNSSVSTSSSTDNGTNARPIPADILITDFSSNAPPPTVRVAVLIAMPSPPPSHGSSTNSTPLSASLSCKTQPTTSHSFELLSTSPTTLRNEEQQPLPHLEIGIVDVVMGSF